ncbi:MAG: ATP-grasp domain-containing protein, partial [Desulfobacterales bacterium]|nr:ATP-grasp domain-containing protein [Desulfobacterales bacterium]
AFLNKIGIQTPKLFQTSSAIEYPFIRKPKKGTGSQGIKIFQKKSSQEKIEILPDSIFQSFIKGIEYTVDVFTTFSGEFIGAVPRRRLATKNGLSVKTVTVEHSTLIKYAEIIVTSLPIIGPANIQFIEDERGICYCTDINPRFGGAYIASVQAGLNAPIFLLNQLTGDPIDYHGYEKGLMMLRYWEEIFEHGNLA